MSLEQTNNFEERRDSIRAKRIVTVRHRLVKHKGKKVTNDWQVSLTENMSFSGLLFASVVKYEADDVVEVEVVMSGLLDIFKGFGEVVRVNKQKGGFYHVAIKYADLRKASKDEKTTKKSKVKK